MGKIISNGIDYSGLNLITPECYSTEERQVGCWTDGKPLYAKTFFETFSTNYVDITIPTTHEIKLLDGGVDSNNHDNFLHLGYGTSSNDMCGAYEYEAGKIRFQNFFYPSRPNGWLVVYYTKSTDTAGSGVWTPSGIPAVHYSTNEHVIGTWIDGKTLYEKTVSFTTGSVGSYNNYETDITSPDTMMIDFSSSFYINGNAMSPAIPYFGSFGENDTNAFAVLCNKVNNKLRIDYRVGNTSTGKQVYVTVRYTKSS